MKTKILKYLTFAGKILGFATSFQVVPFIPQEWGVAIFFGASLLKDGVNRMGDFLDDGKENNSFSKK